MDYTDLINKYNLKLRSVENTDCLEVDSCLLKELVLELKNNINYKFEILWGICACDMLNYFELLYRLYSVRDDNYLIIKTQLIKNNLLLDSISDVFACANFDEREIYDLFGIKFKNHSNLKRIFMPESWQGHPLRKDYVNNDERLEWNNE